MYFVTYKVKDKPPCIPTDNRMKFEIYHEEDILEKDPAPRQVVLSTRKPLSARKTEKDDPYKFYDPKQVNFVRNLIHIS